MQGLSQIMKFTTIEQPLYNTQGCVAMEQWGRTTRSLCLTWTSSFAGEEKAALGEYFEPFFAANRGSVLLVYLIAGPAPISNRNRGSKAV
jgi:hypothetical protein